VCLLCGNYLFISCLLELTVNDHAQSVCYLVSGDQGSRHFLERMFVFLNNEKWCSVHDAQVHRSYPGEGDSYSKWLASLDRVYYVVKG